MLLVQAVALSIFLFVLMKFFEAKRRVLSSVLGSNSTRCMAVCVRVSYCRVFVCMCVCVCVCVESCVIMIRRSTRCLRVQIRIRDPDRDSPPAAVVCSSR